MRTELVTTLKRQATKLLAELEQNRQPILITRHGQPVAFLIDVESYECMQQRMNLLECIEQGEMAIEKGCIMTHEQARMRMARWLK